MIGLAWSWLAVPYVACTVLLLAAGLAPALVRGDRVLRIGMVGAALTAVPWALCQALAACTDDPAVGTRLLRLGQGPVSLVGPNMLLLLLGVGGQLERHRWLARIAGLVGVASLAVCWSTDLTVPGVQRISSGMFYMTPGPLTGLHVSQLIVWLGIGLYIVRRSSPRGERRRTMRLLLGVLVCGAVCSVDTLILYRVWGLYPIAWLPASVAAGIALYLVVRTDLLRPQGFDRAIAIELGGLVVAGVVIAVLALVVPGSMPGIAVLGAVAWTIITGATWGIARTQRVRIAGERELEDFVVRVAGVDDEKVIAERVRVLWQGTIGIAVRRVWWQEDGAAAGVLVEIGGAELWSLEPEVVRWLVELGDALAVTDLATMRLGALRGKLEALGQAHGASLLVPVVDRGELVGLVEASYDKALHDEERRLVVESARALARALTFVGLARAAARERETAREVEVADALRLQASARDRELGRWAVAAEYRSAASSSGAGWSATELADGRLALLVSETASSGVPGALATAALGGAFAAATSGGGGAVTLDDLVAALGAPGGGTGGAIMRGGQDAKVFVALLDREAIEFACIGHPGGKLVGGAAGDPVVLSGRARRELPEDAMLVVASSDDRLTVNVRAR